MIKINLTASPILNPSLSTVTQPAFEIGKTAAALLFKGIEKKYFRQQIEGHRIYIHAHYSCCFFVLLQLLSQSICSGLS